MTRRHFEEYCICCPCRLKARVSSKDDPSADVGRAPVRSHPCLTTSQNHSSSACVFIHSSRGSGNDGKCLSDEVQGVLIQIGLLTRQNMEPMSKVRGTAEQPHEKKVASTILKEVMCHFF